MKKMYKPLLVFACLIALSTDVLAQAGLKANDQLSNLTAPTAVNVDLLPNADGLRNLGSPAFRWNLLHLKSLRLTDGAQALGKVLTSDANGVGTWNAFATGTSGTDFSIDFSGGFHTFNLPSASASNRGLLTPSDWSTFNSKQAALNGTGFVKISGSTISYDNSTYVPTSRTITINGTTLDLNANRSWTINGTGLSLTPIGFNPNANGATVTATTLNLEPANASFGGVVTTSNQTFAGVKNFLSDAIINEITVGKGNGNSSESVAFGKNTLVLNTTGYLNTALGSFSLYNNISGSQNTAVGYGALIGNTTGSFNVATGVYALASNSTGQQNVANGFAALNNNTIGNLNTATGYNALFSNTTGAGNTAGGNGALQLNTTGSWNQSHGTWALIRNTTGQCNSANGALALWGNTTGQFNTANGYYALNGNTTGNWNTGNGSYTLSSNTTGSNNTALGLAALGFNFTGDNNTALGFQANVSSGSLNNATAIGADAIVSASNSVRIGNTAVTSIGGQVEWTTFSDGRYKRNIKNNVPGLEFITKLKPVTYNLDVEDIENKLHSNQKNNQKEIKNDLIKSEHKADVNFKKDNSAMKEAMNEKAKIVYTGFVAQDVEKVAKNIGYDFSGVDKPKDDKESFYGLRYAEFVVPLVKSVQELAKENETLKATNEALNERLNKIEATLGINKTNLNPATDASTIITLSSAKLDQNIPNPARQNTLINYYIPANAYSAEIQINGLLGETIKKVTIPSKGNGQLKLQTALLNSGTYTYSLIVDGKVIDTKKMILAN